MQRATLGKSGSKTASQLQGRTAKAFPSNSLVKTMQMTVVIQYILTATQSFGSQDYCKKSRMTILGLAGVLFYENEPSRIDQMDYRMFRRKYLFGCLGKLGEFSKEQYSNRVQPDYHFIHIVLLFFSVFFSQSLVFLGRLCSKASQHILDIVALG